MNQTRRWLFLALGMASCAWAAMVFYGSYIRVEHHGIVMSIRSGRGYDVASLEDAIAAYESTSRWVPCSMPLLRDNIVTLAQKADNIVSGPDIDAADGALTTMQAGLAAVLSCTPTDGKAWLDLAVLDTHREGLSPRALAAYEMSAKVSPGESWLAEKRLMFALAFLPLLDESPIKIMQQDLAVLDHAHPNRLAAVVKASHMESADILKQRVASQKRLDSISPSNAIPEIR